MAFALLGEFLVNATSNAEKKVSAQLVSRAHGFDDYDITGLVKVHRICVGHGIKRGDIFNVYCDDGVKLGGTWHGSLEKSLEDLASKHQGYAELRAKATVTDIATSASRTNRFELTLAGFDGGTDETDHLILWVESDLMIDQARSWLAQQGLFGNTATDLVTDCSDLPSHFPVDFALPSDELIAHIRSAVRPQSPAAGN